MEPEQSERSNSAAPTDGTGAVDERSGATIAEAVGRAEQGRPPERTHQPPEESAAGSAPVEQHAADPGMKVGQVVGHPGWGSSTVPGPPQHAHTSGGAQSQPGARVSDLVAGGTPVPDGPPTDEAEPHESGE